jgi:hypothetical protein
MDVCLFVDSEASQSWGYLRYYGRLVYKIVFRVLKAVSKRIYSRNAFPKSRTLEDRNCSHSSVRTKSFRFICLLTAQFCLLWFFPFLQLHSRSSPVRITNALEPRRPRNTTLNMKRPKRTRRRDPVRSSASQSSGLENIHASTFLWIRYDTAVLSMVELQLFVVPLELDTETEIFLRILFSIRCVSLH